MADDDEAQLSAELLSLEASISSDIAVYGEILSAGKKAVSELVGKITDKMSQMRSKMRALEMLVDEQDT